MSDKLIPVESIQRLDVNPGDTLVVTLDKDANEEVAKQASEVLRVYIPDDVKLLFLAGEVRLSVLGPEEGTGSRQATSTSPDVTDRTHHST